MLFSLVVSVCSAAVFQEPAAENPNTFKSRFLFSEGLNLSPDTASAKAPEAVGERKAPDTAYDNIFTQKPVIEKTVSSESGQYAINARYIRPSLHSVHRILEKYKSIPGGITLEGSGRGIENVKNVVFDKNSNSFLINNRLVYKNPVSVPEMRYILRAVSQDDRMGVSLGDTDVIYGSLTPGSIPCINLKLADHFLGCIVFANNRWLLNYDFPENYRPRKLFRSGGGYAVYFNFEEFRFKELNNRIMPAESTFTITLIPLTREKGPEGGYMPDFEKIAKGRIPREFESNAAHIVNHIDYYRRDVRVSRTGSYGEAAAFVRALRAEGIPLVTLADSM